MSSRWKKWLKLGLKLLVLGLVVWFVHDALIGAIEKLGEAEFHWRPGWLLLAGVLYSIGLVPTGFFWCRVLRALGQPVQFFPAVRAYCIGHLGKYVPGKAMVIVLRAGLVRSGGVDLGIGAASVFVETLTTMSVGAVLGAAVLAVRLRDERFLFWGSLGMALVGITPTLPPVFRRLVRLARISRSNPEAAAKLSGLGFDTLLIGWVTSVVAWLFLAVSLWATFRGMGIHDAPLFAYLPEYVAAVTLSTVAGFLSMIPGGFGVREAVLLSVIPRLFANVVTQPQAIVASGL
ncbi:MAG: lysylphosphatidylglycerol synthase transmembrane domain-containing protein, partial [Planctomycetota bacterium]